MDNKYVKAGFFRRFFATVLDGIIGFTFSYLVIVLSVLLIIDTLVVKVPFLQIGVFAFIFALSSLLVFFYSWFFIYKYGGTLGKLLFGLRIVNDEGNYIDRATAFWRMTAGYAVSSGFIFLGYLWVFRNNENLTWHDRLFGTKVITVDKPFMGILWLVLLTTLNIVVGYYLLSVIVSAIL